MWRSLSTLLVLMLIGVNTVAPLIPARAERSSGCCGTDVCTCQDSCSVGVVPSAQGADCGIRATRCGSPSSPSLVPVHFEYLLAAPTKLTPPTSFTAPGPMESPTGNSGSYTPPVPPPRPLLS
jgi:hypothetical protein